MLHQKHPRLKIVETQRGLKDLAINYPGMCKLGEEKTWAQTMMERFGVVLAHLRRVQDGTRWIQCTRSMGEPEIQLLKEMVDMIPPEDDFQNVKKPSSSTKPPPDDHSQGEPEDDTQEESHEGSSCGFSSGPTKYKPVSDSGDSAVEVPKVPTTKDKIKKQWAMKKPASSKTSAFSKTTVKTTKNKIKKKDVKENANFKSIGDTRFKMTLASHQRNIQFQEHGQQKWSLWVACSESQCHEHHEVIKKIFQEMPASKQKAVELRNFLI